MKNWKFLHRLLAMLVAALVLCTSVSVLAPHAHAEAVKSPDAGEIPDPGCAHSNLSQYYSHDKTDHWYMCQDCGEKVDLEAHTPGTDVYYNKDGHWTWCTDCGRRIDEEHTMVGCECACGYIGHSGAIVDGVCSVCGGDCLHVSTHVEYDADKHWRVCDDCDKCFYNKMETTEHEGECGNPGVCWICGATDVNVNYVHFGYEDGYFFDENSHWRVCLHCGEKDKVASHVVTCADETTCTVCGSTECADVVIRHNYSDSVCEICGEECPHASFRYDWDDTVHHKFCADCDKHYYDEDTHHTVNCSDDPEDLVCIECGANVRIGAKVNLIHTFENGACSFCGEGCPHDDVHEEYDMDTHFGVCDDCGKRLYGWFATDEHREYCTNPGVCWHCGATGVNFITEHERFDWEKVLSDDTHHWFECLDCGGQAEKQEHYAECTNDKVCVACGAEGTMAEVMHSFNGGVCTACGYECPHDNLEVDTGDWGYTDTDRHFIFCKDCDMDPIREQHYLSCSDPDSDVCALCGFKYGPWIVPEVVHDGEEVYAYDENGHWTACSGCGEALTEAEAHTSNGETNCAKPELCTVCNAVLTAAGNHNYIPTVTAPTCTKDGKTIYYCNDCGHAYTVVLQATGHNYPKDAKFASLNNGYHGIPCYNGCGEQMSEACTMTTVTVGPLSYEMCAVCGYVAKDETTPIVPVIVTNVVENAAIELAQPVEGAVMDLIVHEQQVMAPAVEGVEELKVALRVFNIVMVNDAGVEQTLAGKATVKIPCEAMENVRLVLIKEDGTMVELAFEIKDGMLVFETEELGVFALLPIVA